METTQPDRSIEHEPLGLAEISSEWDTAGAFLLDTG